jgi:Ca2+-binding RTX toxin-like protein
MAVTKISSDKSRFTTALGTPAFGLDVGDDTALADGLTVDFGAFLVATGVGSPGAFLQETGAWTVLVNGSIVSQQSMGIFLLSGNPASSSITIGVDGEVGGTDGIGADSPATIKNSGIVFGTDSGIQLASTGKNTITNVAGAIIIGGTRSIWDQTDLSDDIVTNAGTLVGNVDLGGGNDAFTNSKMLETVVDVDLGAGNDTLTNSGILGLVQLGDGINSATNSGQVSSIEGGKDKDTFKNTNEILGSVILGEGINSLTNSGTIHLQVTAGAGSDTITNSGRIENPSIPGAAVILGGGDNKLTNSGFIGGTKNESVTAGAGNDTIINTGLIEFKVALGEGLNTLSNSGNGQIENVTAGAGNDKVINTGLIEFNVELGEGSNTLTNSGKGQIGFVIAGSGNDIVTNSGTIGQMILGKGDDKLTNSGNIGIIDMGDGDDVVVNTGTVFTLNPINLGVGNDTFTGGAKNDLVFGGAGDDVVKLGAGNDAFSTGATDNSVDGNDFLDGGTGVDVLVITGTDNTTVNLDTVEHDLAAFGFTTKVAKNTLASATLGTDVFTGFEGVHGSLGGNTIYGSAIANNLTGAWGVDLLVGLAGNDTLVGDDEQDHLSGGLGRDVLTGNFELGSGGDADRFLYAAITESGTTKATRDLITDFEDGLDEIWLNPIDANTKNGTTDDQFTFIGNNALFTGAAGQLRTYWTANGHIVEGDVNGDKKADFSIEVFDPLHAIAFDQGDFVL